MWRILIYFLVNNKKCAVGLLLMLLANSTLQAQTDVDSLVVNAVNRIVTSYPKATLQDIYKSFFQERFGPGHIIPNEESAKQYLKKEIAQWRDVCPMTYEPTGLNGDYVRVGLGYVVKGLVPLDIFIDAFVRSANMAQGISLSQWTQEWQHVTNVIDSMNIVLENYAVDKSRIDTLLSSGGYVMHHSQSYRDSYNPHYRIIKKEIFEKEIFPYINKSIDVNHN